MKSPHFPAAILILTLTILVSSQACAAAPAIDIKATLGFSNIFRAAHWTPLTITLSNRGQDVSGFVEVRSRDGEDFRNNLHDITQRRSVDLTRNSRKRMHFTVLLSNVAHPLLIRVLADGEELARKEIDLRTLFTASRLLLVVSRDANLDYLNDNDGSGAGSGSGSGVRVLYPHPELLPDHWQGYDAVSAVLLHGVSLEQLTGRQHEALRKWIAQGGTLAVSGGADYAWLRTPRLLELLPARPIGMVAIEDPASVRDVFGRPLEITAPFHVNKLATSTAKVSIRAANIPLVAEKQFGQGRVLFLTFDVARAPFDRWPGMQQTWFDLLRISANPAPDLRVEATPSPVTKLVELQGKDFPGHGTLLLSLALYLGVLLTTHRLTAPRGATPRLLPTGSMIAIWSAPLLFAMAAWFLFGTVLFDRAASVSVVTIIEPLGDSAYARVQLDLGLHSSREGLADTHGEKDAAGPMTLSYLGVEPTFRIPPWATQISSRNTKPLSWTFREGKPAAITPEDARRYALHLLQGEDIIEFGLRATIDLDGDTPRVNIHNNSGRALQDAWLIADNRAWFIGAVAANGATTYRVDGTGFDLRSRNSEWWARLEQHPTAKPGSVFLLKALLTRKDITAVDTHHAAYPGLGNALLVAGTGPALRPTGLSAAWQHTARTLVLLPMPDRLLVKDESTVTDL